VLRALIFDFDGVIVDSEPVILRLAQEMAALEGWTLTEEDYYRHYLALDDRGLVERLYSSHGQTISLERRAELVEWKARRYQEIIRKGLPPISGAKEFVTRMAQDYPLAIASGSLRPEVEALLAAIRLRENFSVLATADDCQRSKPDPEVYLAALAGLKALPQFHLRPLQPAECLAIEDAPLGVVAAQAAGLKCLALTHSRRREELEHADLIVARFADLKVRDLRNLFP